MHHLDARDFRGSLSSVLDNTRNGLTTHVTRDGRIDGHLVPPTELVHDGNELLVMMRRTLEVEARWLADEVERSGFHQAGDSIGLVYGWLWQCDPEAAVHWLTRRHPRVRVARMMRPAFGPLWRAMRIALKVRLLDGEVKDFEAATCAHLATGSTHSPRRRLPAACAPGRLDDPWPDATKHGIGWAKKRWRDVVEGTFVPNPDSAFELSVDDAGWLVSRGARRQHHRRPRQHRRRFHRVVGRADGSEFSYITPGGRYMGTVSSFEPVPVGV